MARYKSLWIYRYVLSDLISLFYIGLSSILADGELLFERTWLAYLKNHPQRGSKQTNHTQRFYFVVSATLAPTSDTTLRPLQRAARVIHGWAALSWQPTGIVPRPRQQQPLLACFPPAVTTNLDISNETAIFRLRQTMHTTLLLWRVQDRTGSDDGLLRCELDCLYKQTNFEIRMKAYKWGTYPFSFFYVVKQYC